MISGGEITIRNVRDVFFRMEVDESLFDLMFPDGTRYWDVVRLNVFYGLYARIGGPYMSPGGTAPVNFASRLKEPMRRLLNRVTLRYMRVRRPQLLFVTGQRILTEGRLRDNITDHLLALSPGSAVAVETMNRAAIDYRHLLLGRPTRIPPPFLSPGYRVRDLEQAVSTITSILARNFEHVVDVRALIAEPLATFEQFRSYYRQAFKQHRPGAVILINNGSYKGLFAAANEHGIPTVELQHGACSADNPFWSYPSTIDPGHPGLTLPTYYFTFSDYWRTNTHYPVRQSWAIGNDFFHQEPVPGDESRAVIISAYMYHDALRDLTRAVASAFPEKTFFYKLHPHQYEKQPAIVAEFASLPNVQVISHEISIPDLFRQAGFVIGIHSTLMYTALQAGKRVCVYERDNSFWHEDIYPYIERFASAEELMDILRSHTARFAELPRRPSLFDPFSPEKFLAAVHDVTGAAA
jgi:hypothetical protein